MAVLAGSLSTTLLFTGATILTEELVLQVLKVVRRRLADRAQTTTTELPALEKEAHNLKLELDRLVEAVAKGKAKPDVMMDAITERQERLSALEARIRAAKAAPEAIGLELGRMEANARRRISDLQGMLGRNQEARQVIEALMAGGKLVCTPIETNEGRRFRIEGTAAVGRLLCSEFSNLASPRGFETLLTGLAADSAPPGPCRIRLVA